LRAAEAREGDPDDSGILGDRKFRDLRTIIRKQRTVSVALNPDRPRTSAGHSVRSLFEVALHPRAAVVVEEGSLLTLLSPGELGKQRTAVLPFISSHRNIEKVGQRGGGEEGGTHISSNSDADTLNEQ
jgi:hypothetical protein